MCLLQVLDSTLPTAHVISRNYRPSAHAQPAGAGPGKHVGYLPQVDDMLGLDACAKAPASRSAETSNSARLDSPGEGVDRDPFAASSQALRMKSDSVPLNAVRQQSQPQDGLACDQGKCHRDKISYPCQAVPGDLPFSMTWHAAGW